jgi:DNA-binding NarL/FixJ family response regulator
MSAGRKLHQAEAVPPSPAQRELAAEPSFPGEAASPEPIPRLGVVGTDELRIAGLRLMLDDGVRFELVSLGVGPLLDRDPLALVLVDAAATDRLFELLATFRRIRPRQRLLVLGGETSHAYVERVIGAGAKGYLMHTASKAELLAAIAVVCDGSVWAPRKVLAALIDRMNRAAASYPPGSGSEIEFTQREVEILALLVSGQSNREIAGSLRVNESTVKGHLARMMRKAGVDNRTALSLRALERHWTYL